MTSWPLLVSTLLTCCGLGSLFFVGLGEVQGYGRTVRVPALAVCAALLLVAIVVEGVGLGSATAVFAMLRGISHFSGTSLAMLSLIAGFVMAVVYLIVVVRDVPQAALKAIAAVCMLVGILGAWFVGNQYVIANKTNWNSWLLPASYMTNALAMGGTLLSTIMAFSATARGDVRKPAIQTAVVIILQLAALLGYGAFVGWAVDPVYFYVGAIAVGSAAALALDLAALKVPQVMLVAFLCTAAGGMCLRVVMKLLDSDFITAIHAISSGVHGYGL